MALFRIIPNNMYMENAVIERINNIIAAKNLSARSFANTVGFNYSTLNNYLTGRRETIDTDLIVKIASSFDDVSIDWLITGKGEMLKSSPEIQVLNHPKSIERIIEDQDIPLYDISAAANLKTLLGDKSQNIIGKISIPNMPRCDGAVYVRGDSMYPLLKSGDIIIYKEVNNFDYVVFGEMYLVSFGLDGDEYLTVKYVNKSEKQGHITLVSYNLHHQPMDIPIDGIYAMALVKASVRLNTMR